LDIKQPLPKIDHKNISQYDALLETLRISPEIQRKKHLEILLKGILTHSSYLTQLMSKYPDLTQDVLTKPLEPLFKKLLHDIQNGITPEISKQSMMTILRRTKQKASLLIAMADIANIWDLDQVTSALSQLADTCMQSALEHLISDYSTRGVLDKKNIHNCGYTVIAMGKWGGHELNYSSDIDFIILYDPERFLNDENKVAQIANQLTRDLIDIFDKRTVDGYIFRTDMRLRPDPASTPLAISITTADHYYNTMGQNWERSAFIKARPIAGDFGTANTFMAMMKKWIWRQDMDFETIQDIHSIKRQINAQQKGIQEGDFLSRNVKLGYGGIREIEFFVQTQQLIYGGQDATLRSAETLLTLNALYASEHITKQARDQMTASYCYLRKTEHRLQMVSDLQTHNLPASIDKMQVFAQFMGYDTYNNFIDDLSAHLSNVRKHYGALFEDAPDLSSHGNLMFTGTENDPATLRTLGKMGFTETSRVADLIRGWHYGRDPVTESLRARQILTELTPSFLEVFGKTAFPDEAFFNFDKFFSTLEDGTSLLSMFYQNRDMLHLVAEIFGTSYSMSNDLSQHPALFEGLLTKDLFKPLPQKDKLKDTLDKRLLLTQQDPVDCIKRWARGKRFQAGLHIIKHITQPEDCGLFLSDVAELSIQAVLSIIQTDFEDHHGSIPKGSYSIIALGRLGSQQMSALSDIDLIAVYDAPKDAHNAQTPLLSASQYYTKLTQTLIAAISTTTSSEGPLYEVDMRLRPSGNSGSIATEFSGLVDYYKNNAWVWEHMSLIRARAVAGDVDFGKAIQTHIHDILCHQGKNSQLRTDIKNMRKKVAQEFPTDNFWDMKYRCGGLMDIMFIVQYLMLRHAPQYPDILQRDIKSGLLKLQEYDLISKQAAQDLKDMLQLSKRVQAFLRLCISRPFTRKQIPTPLKIALTRIIFGKDTDKTFKDLEHHIENTAQKASKHYNSIIIKG